MRLVSFIVTILLFCGVAMAQPSAQSNLPTPTLEDFLSDADMWSPELSPSGRFVSAGRRDHKSQKSFLIVADLGGEELKIKATDMGDSFVNWVEWISDDKLLISLTGYINLKTGKPVSRQGLENLKKRDVVYPYTRIVSADREFKRVVTMFGESSAMMRNWSLGSVVSFLSNDPDHILMSARSGGDLDLFKVNVHDGTYERIAFGMDNTYAWMVDRDGEPAFRYNTNTRGSVIYIYARENKTNGEIKWRKFKTIRGNRGRGTDEGKEFDPLYPALVHTPLLISCDEHLATPAPTTKVTHPPPRNEQPPRNALPYSRRSVRAQLVVSLASSQSRRRAAIHPHLPLSGTHALHQVHRHCQKVHGHGLQ